MKKRFKVLVSFVVAFTMIFTMGVVSISGMVGDSEENTIEDDNPEILEQDKTVIEDVYQKEPPQTTEEPPQTTEEQEKHIEEIILGEGMTVMEDFYKDEMFAIMEMGLLSLGSYTSDSNIIVPAELTGSSINDHTVPTYLWSSNGMVYVAVKSTHMLEYMTLSGSTSYNFDEYNPWISIFVDGTEYIPSGLQGNTKASHWTVFKFDLSSLYIPPDSQLDFFIKGIGGGHDVGGQMIAIVPKIDVTGYKQWVGGENWPAVNLQLYRYIEGNPSGAVLVDTKTVDGTETQPWYYNWVDLQKSSPYGQQYIYFIDEATVPDNYEKTLNGMTVINTYTPPKGKITITKIVQNPKAEDSNLEFDIFVNGPNGTEYVVTLKNGESQTLENLPLGMYEISEIVPMNYKLVGISNETITLTPTDSEDEPEGETIVTNKPSNGGWFHDDDTRKNTFTVGVITIPVAIIPEKVIIPDDQDKEEQ